jgi:hypothetical protein
LRRANACCQRSIARGFGGLGAGGTRLRAGAAFGFAVLVLPLAAFLAIRFLRTGCLIAAPMPNHNRVKRHQGNPWGLVVSHGCPPRHPTSRNSPHDSGPFMKDRRTEPTLFLLPHFFLFAFRLRADFFAAAMPMAYAESLLTPFLRRIALAILCPLFHRWLGQLFLRHGSPRFGDLHNRRTKFKLMLYKQKGLRRMP